MSMKLIAYGAKSERDMLYMRISANIAMPVLIRSRVLNIHQEQLIHEVLGYLNIVPK